jgi:RNA polymerase sigma factor (sigma-70 family)
MLDEEAFEALLAALAPQRERAGLRYEEIRQALIRYLRFRGSLAPEEHADEAIDIMARRIHEGEAFNPLNPKAHFFFVARNLVRDQRKKRGRFLSIDDLSSDRLPSCDDQEARRRREEMEEEERALARMRLCLKALSTDERSLIRRYYSEEKSTKIKERKEMAQEAGRSLNSLRVLAHRIRQKLKRCFDERRVK